MPFLPYGRQSIDEADIAAVADVLRSDRLTTGPAVDAFETDFAAATGARYAVACSSGTAALHLAVCALGLQPADRAVVPSVTFLATANAVRYSGAEVVLADVDPDTALLTPTTLTEALHRADGPVRAAFPVHMAGQIVDLDGLEAIASRRNVTIVEDACHAIGGRDSRDRAVGSCAVSKMAAFSLHPIKTVTGGECGVVTTNDADLANTLRQFLNHGIVKENFRFSKQADAADGSENPWYYEMSELGFNYRLSDIHAALARSQMSKLGRFVSRRQALVERYDALLQPLAPIIRPSGRAQGSPGWHLYVVLMDFDALGMDRAAVMHHLHERGIGSQVHYIPLHRQPYYQKRYGDLNLPGADRWYSRALSLPLFPAMADQDVDRVVSALDELVEVA